MNVHDELPAGEGVALTEIEQQQSEVFEQPTPYSEKVQSILEACHDTNLDVLVELATSKGGLVNDELRQTACKFLTPLLIVHYLGKGS
jgi:hypothetical protein